MATCRFSTSTVYHSDLCPSTWKNRHISVFSIVGIHLFRCHRGLWSLGLLPWVSFLFSSLYFSLFFALRLRCNTHTITARFFFVIMTNGTASHVSWVCYAQVVTNPTRHLTIFRSRQCKVSGLVIHTLRDNFNHNTCPSQPLPIRTSQTLPSRTISQQRVAWHLVGT